MLDLSAQWRSLCRRLHLPPAAAEALLADLLARYSEDGRFYHTQAHVAEMLALLAAYQAWVVDETAVALAIWYHDAVYDPRAADNEARSAALARRQLTLPGLSPALIDEAARLILLTQTHETAAADANGRFLLDADLAILGAAPDRYDWYAAAIRQEYHFVPPDVYRAGRSQVLARFLARDPIYHIEPLHRRGEAQARRNLQRELAALRATG